MKTVVLGDVHGRTIWKDILDKEQPDRTVFLGDYVSSHEAIPGKTQIHNLLEILDLKEHRPDEVFLLRGNHDLQHLGYSWAECSGYNPAVAMEMPTDRFLQLTQWTVVDDELRTVFSHAGISKIWMENSDITDIHDINFMKPSELFGFIPNSWDDYSGDSVTQSPTWIRPWALTKCNISGWKQVVGHTPVRQKIFNIAEFAQSDEDIWRCDALALKQYLVIDNGAFKVKKITSFPSPHNVPPLH